MERLAEFWAEGDNAQRFPECMASLKIRQEPDEEGRGMFIRKILGRLTPTHPKMLEWMAGEEKRKLEASDMGAETAPRAPKKGRGV